MSNRHTWTLSAFLGAVLLAFPLPSHAEDITFLHGQIRADSQGFFEGLFASMEEVATRNATNRVDVALDGTFEFRHVQPGDYVLRIVDQSGQTVAQNYVSVQHSGELMIHLPDSGRRPSAPGTVSLTQLRHPPAKKAVQAFAAASKFADSGKYDQAVEQLQKAIQISPEFASAYTNLAVQHMRMHRFQEAADESARAIQIAGPDPLNLCNLAFAQFQLGRFDESAASARASLRLDASYLQAHLVLGAILANDPSTRPEAIQHLELAAQKFQSARISLEKLRASR